MLPLKKEMIGLLVKGASTPLENLQVSFFLVAWPVFLLAILRMVQNEKETQSFARAGSIQELARDFGRKAEKDAKSKGRRTGKD